MRDKFGRFKKGNIPWDKGKHIYCGGKRFEKGQIPWNKGKKLGFIPKCAFKKGNIPWHMGTAKPMYKSTMGYIYILKPEHPFRKNKKYVLRSRLIMEEYLGRYLDPQEIVHHINGIKDDDRIENFILFTNESGHKKFHRNSSLIKPEEIVFDSRKL